MIYRAGRRAVTNYATSFLLSVQRSTDRTSLVPPSPLPLSKESREGLEKDYPRVSANHLQHLASRVRHTRDNITHIDQCRILSTASTETILLVFFRFRLQCPRGFRSNPACLFVATFFLPSSVGTRGVKSRDKCRYTSC